MRFCRIKRGFLEICNMKIFTLEGYFNYGNRLQLFALSKTLKNLSGSSITSYWPKTFKSRIKELLRYKLHLLGNCKKEIKLKDFTKKYICKNVKSLKCSYSVIGSDQVWNPDYLKSRLYLLNVPNNSIKISYAASIGKEQLTEVELSCFKKALKDYKAISVREKSAKDLLQPLTDKKVEVVLDPTLLVDKSEYEKLEKRPKNLRENEKYILCYILGGREQMDAINKCAKENNYKIILFSDKKDSDYGVEEFLYLIHHAELICTDSFHACVFSFIFEKPFVAFKRTGAANYMYTRLQNLIDTFELKNREFNGKEISEKNLNADYNNAKKILKKEQEKSLNFLRKALDIKNEK